MSGAVRAALAFLALAAAATGALADPVPVPVLAPAEPARMEPVFLWARDRCADDDIPDAPLRAVRLDGGAVIAFAAHERNRRFVGADLTTLRRDCRVVYTGDHSDKPEDYSDRVWIAALWSEDGRRVFALGHDEYQAHRRPDRCPLANYAKCWWNAIVALRSDDGGQTFAREGERPVAAAPFRQDFDQGRPRGFFEPSNIVKRDGAYFALIRAGAEGAQKAGECLFRTDDLTHPDAWRFFDGDGFSRSLDPYRDDVSDAKPCAPLHGLRGSVGSVSYAPALGVYIAVSAFGSKSSSESGFFYSVSADLIHWSDARLFLAVATPWSGVGDEDRFMYPSLVDPASPSRNFDVVGASPDLYFVRQHFDHGHATMQRDLVRMKLRLSPP